MFTFCGRLPAIMLAVGMLLSSWAVAQQRIPLTLAEAERLALEAEPGLAALHERAAALGEQSIAAGQLPDPQLRVGLLNYPINSGGFSTEGMTQAQLAYRQSFPSGELRDNSVLQYESLANAATENAAARTRDIRMQTRHAWLEVYYWERSFEIANELRPFFTDLVAVTRSLYSVGSKTQHDVLRAELELARLDDRLIEISRRRSQSQSDLSRWLGDAAYRPIAHSLPAFSEVPELDALHAGLANHPSLSAADAQIAASDAEVVQAEAKKKPGWAVDVGYGYREGFQQSGEPRSDFVSVAVTVDLPIFSKNRHDRRLAAALRERNAARYDKSNLLRQLASQLDSEYLHYLDLTRRAALFETRILDLSESQAQAALVAYQADTGDFADVMRSFIDDLNTRIDHVRLRVERARSHAVLANLGGFQL
jgi:outer membrane protein TolC